MSVIAQSGARNSFRFNLRNPTVHACFHAAGLPELKRNKFRAPPHTFNRPRNEPPAWKIIAPFTVRADNANMIYLIAGILGLVSGIFSGIFGVGGGVVMIPGMVYLMKLPVKTAIGTSLAVIVPTAIAGSAKHLHSGNVDLKVVAMLAPLAIVGGLFGAWLATRVPAETLKRLFGAFIICVGVHLAFFK